MNWFSNRSARKRPEVPRLRPRGAVESATRVDLAELTPDLPTFLGRAAYLQLMIFENLSTVVATAPTTPAKEHLSRAAARALARHHGLTDELARHGDAPGDVMGRFSADIDAFQLTTTGADWHENLVTCHVTAGFLDDFFVRLAAGLPGDYAARVTGILTTDAASATKGGAGRPVPTDTADEIAAELRAAIDASPELASRLAMWGRRLIGDTMLVARAALVTSANHDSDEARIEPVFTELIAAHTRRMDALGLTA